MMSCGGSSNQESSTSELTTEEPKKEMATDIPDTAFLTIEGNDLMQYNLDKLEVYEGQVVKLTLEHVGGMSVEAMGHNWVLLTPGTDKATFGAAAVSARETSYIPQDMTDKVIANTKVIGGGESTSVIFDAPKTGFYDYLCSFPGHWGVMQGSFIVKPR
jgi:azurin